MEDVKSAIPAATRREGTSNSTRHADWPASAHRAQDAMERSSGVLVMAIDGGAPHAVLAPALSAYERDRRVWEDAVVGFAMARRPETP